MDAECTESNAEGLGIYETVRNHADMNTLSDERLTDVGILGDLFQTIAMDVVFWDGSLMDGGVLITRADDAMQQAKLTGRNRVVVRRP